jgi:anaerobic magnesium-protoporphyrin IX monomethyl ester cyclase
MTIEMARSKNIAEDAEKEAQELMKAAALSAKPLANELAELEGFLAADPDLKNQDKRANFHIVLIALFSYGSFSVHSLGSLLRSKGFKVSYVFFKEAQTNGMALPEDEEYKLLEKLLGNLAPDLIGLSFMSAFAPAAKEVTKLARQFGAPVIWGGAHAVDASDDSIEHADIVCLGDGEFPLLKLAYAMSNGESYDHIKNLGFNNNGKPKKNELYPLLQNLDLVPFPVFGDADKYSIDRNKLNHGDPHYISELSWYNIMTGRGCPYSCSFCSNSFLNEHFKGKGNILRRRTVDNVIEELANAKSRFPKLVGVSGNDEVFILQRDWLVEFSKRYKKEINIPFHCDTFPSRINDETIGLLRSMNTRTVSVGLQSGSERMRLDVYKRHTPDKMLIEAGETLKKYGIFPSYDVIFDNPLETKEDLDSTLNFITQLPRPYRLNTYSLQNHPSTTLTESLLEKEMISTSDIDGFSLKGLDHWQMSLRHHEKGSDIYHIYCLLKLYSSSFGIITPYFNRRFPVFPNWFLKLLVQNKDTIKNYPGALTSLCHLGEGVSNFFKFLSSLLSGHFKRIVRKFNRLTRTATRGGAAREGLTT